MKLEDIALPENPTEEKGLFWRWKPGCKEIIEDAINREIKNIIKDAVKSVVNNENAREIKRFKIKEKDERKRCSKRN